jgi:hypothetical protein
VAFPHLDKHQAKLINPAKTHWQVARDGQQNSRTVNFRLRAVKKVRKVTSCETVTL